MTADTYFTVREEQAPTKKGTLDGIRISVKDNVCVRRMESTATSDILRGYDPEIEATSVARARAAGATIIGKTTMDAFGFGSANQNVGLGYEAPSNPHDPERVTGGSSGGAAGYTAIANERHVAIAESTGGSIECPAAWCGVIGLCPTYGRVSRHGLISYADSLDKIGLMATNVTDIKLVLSVIAGHDEKDGTSLQAPVTLDADEKPLRIGVIQEAMDAAKPAIRKEIERTIEHLKNNGHNIKDVSLPLTHTYGVPAYYLLATSEASTNLARLCGLRFGRQHEKKNKSYTEYFKEVRSEHFNDESKRRILLGTFARMAGYRDAYYLKAAQIRTKIIQEYEEAFETYDILIGPTMPNVAPRKDELEQLTPAETYAMDKLTVGPNLAGIPHASIPCGTVDGMPIGLQAMAKHLDEATLLKFLTEVER